jgi:Uma2 family endonuclease
LTTLDHARYGLVLGGDLDEHRTGRRSPSALDKEGVQPSRDQGFFHPEEKLELIEGIIYKKARQSPAHAAASSLLNYVLRSTFAEGYEIRPGLPLVLGPYSEPEPDIAVVPGAPGDYVREHPAFALLVIEVADASLLHDRKKADLYARAGIPEYWLLNLVDWCLEVYRDLKDGVYTVRLILRDGDSVSALDRPQASIPVASLLPRK